MNLCIHTDGGDSSNVFNKIGFARILRTFGAVDSGYQCLLFDIFRHIINDMYFSEDAFGRITSYNVCYTKLLRPEFGHPADFAQRHGQYPRDQNQGFDRSFYLPE